MLQLATYCRADTPAKGSGRFDSENGGHKDCWGSDLNPAWVSASFYRGCGHVEHKWGKREAAESL